CRATAPSERGWTMNINEQASSGPSAPEPSRLDTTLHRLRERAPAFARLSPLKKADLLREVRQRFFEISERMVELGNERKGVSARSSAAGEEWFSGPDISLRSLRLFEASLRDVATRGAPRISEQQRGHTHHGRALVTLTPRDSYDAVVFRGWRAEAWFEAGVEPHDVSRYQASFYRQSAPSGHVVLVLGAGNVGSISVLDVLYHSFVEGGVCLLKMSPVNDYLMPYYERAFAPLIELGYLAITSGDSEIGRYLVSHPAVDAIHVTGSVETHDRIVWGTGADAERRRRENEPLTQKRVTSELGNVSPVLVVPAVYSERDLSSAARSVAGMFVHNGSFNCNAAKLLVTARDWPQREAFLQRLGHVLADVPTRVAYYPGAHERFDRLLTGLDSGRLERFGATVNGALPWVLVRDLEPTSNSPLFRIEPFCSILSEVALPCADTTEFLRTAVPFTNERVWGTLNAMLIAPDRVEKDPALSRELDRALAELRYGTVALNVWPAVGYGLGTPPWGGYPGATLADVQSGLGWGHNALLLERVEKAVLRGPLRLVPPPFWEPGHAHLCDLGRALAGLEAEPSVSGVARAAWAAFRP
ncbi:MAG TPA: aldehyde dehydrogenase family protein, partial [Polyangiaceae bacterium]|nr:aldehyde dehydrogenase family protein [Polyangiaceae bacterium]